jgi:hypothetical protein
MIQYKYIAHLFYGYLFYLHLLSFKTASPSTHPTAFPLPSLGGRGEKWLGLGGGGHLPFFYIIKKRR